MELSWRIRILIEGVNHAQEDLRSGHCQVVWNELRRATCYPLIIEDVEIIMKPIIFVLLATIGQPASAAVEACMIGTWIADMGDIADMMALQMSGEATPVAGEVSMEILANGTFTLLVDDMIINVRVPDVPPMDVKVVGYSAGHFDASENTFLATADDYALVGSADVLGNTMEIPFTSETGLAGGGLGWFECVGDTLRFEQNVGGPVNANRMPRLWTRL